MHLKSILKRIISTEIHYPYIYLSIQLKILCLFVLHQEFFHALHPFMNPVIIIMVEIRLDNKGIHGIGFIPFIAKYA